jgi:DNA-binding response OmpR family regulator
MKIVIVEDTVKIRQELSIFLQRYGYEVVALERFDNPIEDIFETDGDLLLLDINLPTYDGYYICREIRAKSDMPIIVVTSRDSEMDELMSMNLGADDFITKPYNTEILLARIQSILKRTKQISTIHVCSYGGVELDTGKWAARCGNEEETFTKNEFQILRFLVEAKGRIVTRDELMDHLWQSNEFVDDNTLTVNINRIRKKLEEIGAKDYVGTKRGVGYFARGIGE